MGIRSIIEFFSSRKSWPNSKCECIHLVRYNKLFSEQFTPTKSSVNGPLPCPCSAIAVSSWFVCAPRIAFGRASLIGSSSLKIHKQNHGFISLKSVETFTNVLYSELITFILSPFLTNVRKIQQWNFCLECLELRSDSSDSAAAAVVTQMHHTIDLQHPCMMFTQLLTVVY